MKDKELMDLIKERYSAEAIYPNRNSDVLFTPSLLLSHSILPDESGVDDEEYKIEEEDHDINNDQFQEDNEYQIDQNLIDINDIDSNNSNQNYEFSQNDLNCDEITDLNTEIETD